MEKGEEGEIGFQVLFNCAKVSYEIHIKNQKDPKEIITKAI